MLAFSRVAFVLVVVGEDGGGGGVSHRYLGLDRFPTSQQPIATEE